MKAHNVKQVTDIGFFTRIESCEINTTDTQNNEVMIDLFLEAAEKPLLIKLYKISRPKNEITKARFVEKEYWTLLNKSKICLKIAKLNCKLYY